MLHREQKLPEYFEITQPTDLNEGYFRGVVYPGIAEDEKNPQTSLTSLDKNKQRLDLITQEAKKLSNILNLDSTSAIALYIKQRLEDIEFSFSSIDSLASNNFFMSLALCLASQEPESVGMITFQDLLKDKNGTRLSSLELNDGEYEDFLFELVYGLARLRGSISGSEPNLDTNLRDPVEIIEELDLIGSLNDTTDLVALLA